MSDTRGTYSCEACTASFNSQQELNNHNQQAHSASGEATTQSKERM